MLTLTTNYNNSPTQRTLNSYLYLLVKVKLVRLVKKLLKVARMVTGSILLTVTCHSVSSKNSKRSLKISNKTRMISMTISDSGYLHLLTLNSPFPFSKNVLRSLLNLPRVSNQIWFVSTTICPPTNIKLSDLTINHITRSSSSLSVGSTVLSLKESVSNNWVGMLFMTSMIQIGKLLIISCRCTLTNKFTLINLLNNKVVNLVLVNNKSKTNLLLGMQSDSWFLMLHMVVELLMIGIEDFWMSMLLHSSTIRSFLMKSTN